MDLLNTVRKEGSRGGRAEFKWSDVQQSQHRENYLGHSLMAPVGRWQQGKDLNWYAKGDDKATAEEKRKEEIRKVKEAEEEARRVALGLPPKDGDGEGSNPNMIKVDGGKQVGRKERDRKRDGEKRRHRSRSREGEERRHGHRRHRSKSRDGEARGHRRHRSRSRDGERKRHRSRSADVQKRRHRHDRSRERHGETRSERHDDRRGERSASREHHRRYRQSSREHGAEDHRGNYRRDERRDRSRSPPYRDDQRRPGRHDRSPSPAGYRRRKSRSGSSRGTD